MIDDFSLCTRQHSECLVGIHSLLVLIMTLYKRKQKLREVKQFTQSTQLVLEPESKSRFPSPEHTFSHYSATQCSNII